MSLFSSRFARVFLVVAVTFSAVLPAPSVAQDRGDSPADVLGDLFRDILRPGEDATTARPSAPGEPARRPPQSRNAMMMSFSPLVKQTAPAVVNVYADRMVQRRTSPFAGDPFFEQFFGQSSPGRTERQSSLGSGVIIDSRGIVVTNNHVIENADDIRIALADGSEFESRVLLKDDRFDLAILQIDGGGPFPVVEFGNSDGLEVGDIVLAIGNPFGVGQTVTSGIVSALARNRVGISDFGFFIQTDAAINPGNSGGALIDMNGRLIGINTAIFTRSGGSNGIGFAIPANLVRAVAETAESGGDQFERPWIGATFEPVTPDIAEALGLGRALGAFVSAVDRGGPAEKAGLKPGDIIYAFNRQPIEHPDALGYRLATAGIGTTAEFGVITREGRSVLRMKLQAAPKDSPAQRAVLSGRNPFSGAIVAEISPRLADRLRLPASTRGVAVIETPRDSLAVRYGVRPGDIIAAVNGSEITTVAGLEQVLEKGARTWRFDLIRNGQRIRQVIR